MAKGTLEKLGQIAKLVETELKPILERQHTPADIDEFRILGNGSVKNTRTGHVNEPLCQPHDEFQSLDSYRY